MSKTYTGENPVEEYAITGTMFFRDKTVYNKSLVRLFEMNEKVNGEFYVDSLLNAAIDLGYK